MTDINYFEPALVVQYLILCQNDSHLVVLSDNWFSLLAHQQGALDLKQIHDLFNVSKQLPGPEDFSTERGHVLTKGRTVAKLLVRLHRHTDTHCNNVICTRKQ